MPTSRREIASKQVRLPLFTRIRCIAAIAHHRSYFGDDDSKPALKRLKHPVLLRMLVDIVLDPRRREGDQGGDDLVPEEREAEVTAVFAGRAVTLYRDITTPHPPYWGWGKEVGTPSARP